LPSSPDIRSLYKRVQRAGNIQDMMAISNFLNLIDKKELEIEEEQVVNLEELLQDVLSKHFVI
jgi:hypothetical protein